MNKSQTKPEIRKFKLNSLENEKNGALSKKYSVQYNRSINSSRITFETNFAILLVAQKPSNFCFSWVLQFFLQFCRTNASRYDLFLLCARSQEIPKNGKKIMIDITFLSLWINIFVIRVF